MANMDENRVDANFLTAPFQQALAQAQALQQRLASLAAPPVGQAVDQAALLEAVQALSEVLAEARRAAEAAQPAQRESEARYRELYVSAQRQAQEIALYDRVRLVVMRELDLAAVIRSAVEGIAETFGYVLVSLYLRQGEVLALQHQVGYRHTIDEIPVTHGILGRVVRTGQPVFLKDIHADGEFLGAIDGLTSEVAVPLFDQGQVVGALNVESQQGVELTEADLRLLTALSDQIGLAIGRARLYDKIRESEMRYRALVEASPEAISLTDLEGQFLAYNQKFAQLYGLADDPEAAQAAGLTIMDLVAEPDRPRALEEVEKTLKEGFVRDVEYLTRRADGTVFPTEVSAAVIRDAAGQPSAYMTLNRDITDRKRAEAALREAQEFLANLLEHTPVSIYVTTADGRLRLVNRRWEQDTRQPRAAVIGRPLGQVFPPEVARQLEADNQRVIQANAALVYEETLGAPVEPHYFLTIKFPLHDAAGQVEAVGGFSLDITERKQAEAALQESEIRYRSTFEQAPLGIANVSPDGRFLRINQRFCDIIGYSQAEALNLTFQAITHPDDIAGSLALVQRLQTGDQPQEILEKRYVRKDGGLVWVYLTSTAVRGAAGELKYYISTIEDITGRKQMEQALLDERASLARRVAERTAELTAANTALTQALHARDDFLAMMSHELRTPLTSILGLSESLEMEAYGPLTEKQTKSLHTIHSSGEHLLALITDVLDLARIGAGKLELQLNLVAVEDTCQAALRLIAPQAQKKTIQVTSRFESGVTTLNADARRLKQMLINLLSNAVKFTPPGGAIGLEVTGDAERQTAYFAVWDTGVGISPPQLRQLFQPFVQVDSSLSRRYEGAGLGLALTRRLAELHGGGVSVESEEGKGSRFTLALPWSPNTAPIPPKPELEHPSAGLSAAEAASGPLILLAEDNAVIASTFADVLQVQGYRVIIAADGVEALELARLHRPALVLMDLQMPGLDGLEATRRLRADPDLAAIPVVALTALAMPGDRERSLSAGANDYLTKPVRWAELLMKIENLLK